MQSHRPVPGGSSAPDFSYAYTQSSVMGPYFLQRDDGSSAVPECTGWGTDLSQKGLRIASIFIILASSLLGVFLPMFLARTSATNPYTKLAFFVAKYFGSGVILATAFMHLLSPAVEALSDPCLANILPDYDWGHLICLITIMIMFYIELMAARFNFSFSHVHDDAAAPADELLDSGSPGPANGLNKPSTSTRRSCDDSAADGAPAANAAGAPVSSRRLDDVESTPSERRLSLRQSCSHNGGLPRNLSYPPGNEDHLAHGKDHVPGDSHASYGSQIVSLLILEFGVVFHSLFIGLSLAGSDDLRILLVVITFHQLFEGLGLGSRLAVADWPSDWKAWTGYLMAFGYGVTTPIGIAIGLGVNAGLNANPDVAQLVNGIFDAVSAGILVYTGLVELLAHEFMFNPEMRDAKLSVQTLAYACVAAGVGLMSLLAVWA